MSKEITEIKNLLISKMSKSEIINKLEGSFKKQVDFDLVPKVAEDYVLTTGNYTKYISSSSFSMTDISGDNNSILTSNSISSINENSTVNINEQCKCILMSFTINFSRISDDNVVSIGFMDEADNNSFSFCIQFNSNESCSFIDNLNGAVDGNISWSSMDNYTLSITDVSFEIYQNNVLIHLCFNKLPPSFYYGRFYMHDGDMNIINIKYFPSPSIADSIKMLNLSTGYDMGISSIENRLEISNGDKYGCRSVLLSNSVSSSFYSGEFNNNIFFVGESNGNIQTIDLFLGLGTLISKKTLIKKISIMFMPSQANTTNGFKIMFSMFSYDKENTLPKIVNNTEIMIVDDSTDLTRGTPILVTSNILNIEIPKNNILLPIVFLYSENSNTEGNDVYGHFNITFEHY